MDYSQITEHLFIGTTPDSRDYQHLRDLGVRLVINMRLERRPYPDFHSPPLQVLWLPSVDSPLTPIPLRTLRRGAAVALDMIGTGGKVYIHCAQGRHRSVALGTSILFATGYTLEDAFQLVKLRRQVADPHIWYIRWRIERFAATWTQYLQKVPSNPGIS